nr:hypothetical protein CFP56_18152 [Quercus suber]
MFKPSFIIHFRDFAAPGYWEYKAIKEFTIILIYMAKILDGVAEKSNFCIGSVNAHLQDTSYASCSFLSVFQTMFKPSFIIHFRDFAAPGYWEYKAIKEFTIILIYMAKILDGVAEKRFHKQLCMTGSKLSQQIIDIIFL